jgi:hypothetical protein
MAWSPLTHEHTSSVLICGTWDQSLYFLNSELQQ